MPNPTLAPPKRSIRTATASLMAVPRSGSRPSTRLHALDALRGIAMLLGVVLHSSISYMEQRMPDLLWAVQDSSRSAVFDWLFWWLHGFRLPLFFVIAGFFSAQLYERRGAREFLRQRGKRLLVPFLAGVAIILPLTFGVWCCGWLSSGSCSLENIRRMKFDPAIQDNLYGPAHLWFLEYLFLMCMMYCFFRLSLSQSAGTLRRPPAARKLATEASRFALASAVVVRAGGRPYWDRPRGRAQLPELVCS